MYYKSMHNARVRKRSTQIHLHCTQIFLCNRTDISAYKICQVSFFPYDNSPVLLAADYTINSSFFLFLFLFVFPRASVWERGTQGGRRGLHPAPLCSANCHVHLARHLYLSPERIKHALVNTAFASRGHDFDWFTRCASRLAVSS